MLKIKLPPLHEAIPNNEESDLYGHIFIRNGVAIVIGANYIFCFDIKNFYVDNGLVKDEEHELFDDFLNFIENKNFQKEFWLELSKADSFKVIDEDCIFIEKKNLTKYIFYKESDIDISGQLKFLKDKLLKNHEISYNIKAIDSHSLTKLLKVFGKYLLSSSLVIKSISDKSVLLFTTENIPYVFGLIANNSETAETKLYMFDSFKDFVSEEIPNVPKPQPI